jgi:hypothetical protein
MQKISDCIAGKSFYRDQQLQKIKKCQAELCAKLLIPDKFWKNNALTKLLSLMLEPLKVNKATPELLITSRRIIKRRLLDV